MHGTAGAPITGDLIGYTTGVLITLVLLAFTLRAAKLPGTPSANIIFAVCGLLWSAGGLVRATSLGSGIGELRGVASVALAVQYTGAAAFPIAILAICRRFAIQSWQRRAARILDIFAIASAAAIAFSFGLHLYPDNTLITLTAYNASVLLVAGPLVSLRRATTPRSVYLPSFGILYAVVTILIFSVIAQLSPAPWLTRMVSVSGAHLVLVLLVMIFAFVLFARFRYADVFIRYTVRIFLAVAWAFVIVVTAQSAFTWHVVNHMSSPAAIHVFLVLITAIGLLLSFTFVDDRISAIVGRMMFRAPDYRQAARQFTGRVRDLHRESEILAGLEEAARVPLALEAARIVLFDRSSLLEDHIKAKLEPIGLGWVNFQVLRRTHASLGHRAKVDPKVSADQRGHGIGVALDVYTKSSMKDRATAAKQLEDSVFTKPVRARKKAS